jgi:membrane-bound ClpP family serine protease
MKTAVDALTHLSLDPEAQRIAWERDRNERAARHMMGSAIKAADDEGYEKGTRRATRRSAGERLRCSASESITSERFP